MTVQITITSRWMKHTGGTKFYRPILVKVGEDTAVVGNYGSIKPRGGVTPSATDRPVRFGQCKVYAGGPSFFHELTQEKEKMRGGGCYVREGCDQTETLHAKTWGHDDIQSALATHFGANVAHELMNTLGLNQPVEFAEVAPSTERETTPIETTPRPASWGTW